MIVTSQPVTGKRSVSSYSELKLENDFPSQLSRSVLSKTWVIDTKRSKLVVNKIQYESICLGSVGDDQWQAMVT